MKFISHRSNIQGPDFDRENNPLSIIDCLEKGFDVEVDLWWYQNKFWFGHDKPIYPQSSWNGIDLRDNRLWCHAKNLQAFEELYRNPDINVFWHQTDDIAITTKGYIWTYPGKKLLCGAIMVKPEENYRVNGIMPHDAIQLFLEDIRYYKADVSMINGICSDYIEVISNAFESHNEIDD